MTLTPVVLNDIIVTSLDVDSLVLTGLNIFPLYWDIRHTLYDPQLMVQWKKHSGKRYHKYIPYTHMLREAYIWIKIVINCLILGLHCTDITWDRVWLVYSLMTPTYLKIEAILKSILCKTRVHKGKMYAFGGLITRLFCFAVILEEKLDYLTPLFPTPVDITKTKGPRHWVCPNSHYCRAP